MKIAKIEVNNINDVVWNNWSIDIWVCGCKKRCEGCHNPELQDFNSSVGRKMDLFEIRDKIKEYSIFANTVCFLGGDFSYFPNELYELAGYSQALGLKTLLYSGFDGVTEKISEKCEKVLDKVIYGEYNKDSELKTDEYEKADKLNE